MHTPSEPKSLDTDLPSTTTPHTDEPTTHHPEDAAMIAPGDLLDLRSHAYSENRELVRKNRMWPNLGIVRLQVKDAISRITGQLTKQHNALDAFAKQAIRVPDLSSLIALSYRQCEELFPDTSMEIFLADDLDELPDDFPSIRILRKAHAEAKTVPIPNYNGLSLLVIPIILNDDTVLGVLKIVRSGRYRISPEDQRLFSQFEQHFSARAQKLKAEEKRLIATQSAPLTLN